MKTSLRTAAWVSSMHLLFACAGGSEASLTATTASSDVSFVQESNVPATSGEAPVWPIDALASANNAFAFELLGEIDADQRNVVVSPLGISTVLAMAYAGAEGSTADGIAAALQFDRSASPHAAIAAQWQAWTGAHGAQLQLRAAQASSPIDPCSSSSRS